MTEGAPIDEDRSRTCPDHFVSVDWSLDPFKRAVCAVDMRNRTINRVCRSSWTLQDVIDLAERKASDGSVLVGMDVALGVPAGYWEAARRIQSGQCDDSFVEWLGRKASASDFFEVVPSPLHWRIDRPFFRVPPGEGGLRSITSLLENGFYRRIDRWTGAKPLFAVSGIPGTVGSGTRNVWTELATILHRERKFAIWPFEGQMPRLLDSCAIVLAESYPALAYGIVLAESLPACRMRVAKTDRRIRHQICAELASAAWIRNAGVTLMDMTAAAENEDVFDALVTAAAVLRCAIEGSELCAHEFIDPVCEGGMLLAGPALLLQPARTFRPSP